MGLTIHYSGRIADKSKLPQLIEEVEEIVNEHGWKYTVYDREFPTHLIRR
jgi:transposase